MVRRRRINGPYPSPDTNHMRIHYLQHVPFEGLGSIAAWAEERGHGVTGTPLYADAPLPALDSLDWLIVMGGPMNVYETERYPWLISETRFIREAIAAQKRVLGICLGAQLIAVALGARVNADACQEIGWAPVTFADAGNRPVLRGLPERIEAFHWHSDTFEVPSAAAAAAASEACANQMFIYRERVVAMQFHLETTPAGAELLIDHCGGARRQALGRELLSDSSRFTRLRTPMWRLLDNLQAL